MQLLKILFAKECHIRTGLEKKLRDDCRNPIEMAGPERSAQALAHRAHRNRRGKVLRIHIRRVRRIEDVGAERRQLGGIVIFGARIGSKISGAVELLRIDKERHDHPIAHRECGTHQAEMPLMQSPMVGTTATLKPSRRHTATMLRSSATVRIMGMPMPHLLLSGVRLVAEDVLCRWKAALANIVGVGRDCRGSHLAVKSPPTFRQMRNLDEVHQAKPVSSAGASPARVKGSACLVVSVASWEVTSTAKRTALGRFT